MNRMTEDKGELGEPEYSRQTQRYIGNMEQYGLAKQTAGGILHKANIDGARRKLLGYTAQLEPALDAT